MQIIHLAIAIAIATDIIHRAGYLEKQAKTGAVTYIQRFGSVLNLNIHFHMLFLEGMITQERGMAWHGMAKLKCVKAPAIAISSGLFILSAIALNSIWKNQA
jgi:hypothetical protein